MGYVSLPEGKATFSTKQHTKKTKKQKKQLPGNSAGDLFEMVTGDSFNGYGEK